MSTLLLKAWNGLQSSLPTRRQSAGLVVISALCVVTPLVTLIGLQQKTQEFVGDRPTSPEQPLHDERYRALAQQHSAAIILGWVTASVGLLSSLATFYLLRRLHQELHRRTTQWQDSKALIHAIETSMTDGLFILNSQGYIETINPAATRIFGYDQSEMVGKPLNLLVEQPSTEDNTDRSSPSLRSQRWVAHHKRGTSFPIQFSLDQATPQRQRIAIVRDLTQQEQTEAELRSQLTNLARVTAELTQARVDLQTVYVTCHDFKSPLQAILHLSEWLQADLTERVRADTQNQFNLLQERVRRLEGLVETILKSAPPQERVHR